MESNGKAPPAGPYPCITSLKVDGAEIVPPIAVGALFQMDIRSYAGNNYNPTQSGACYGASSVLKGYQQNWNAISQGSSGNGLLLGVQPLTFESSTGACTNGELTPYSFNWGITLGDGSAFPEQAMIVVQVGGRGVCVCVCQSHHCPCCAFVSCAAPAQPLYKALCA